MRWILVVVVLLLAACKDERLAKLESSKRDIARLTAQQYANEAFLAWARVNPSKQCPDKIQDLDEYMNSPDIKDPWGNYYRMRCGDNLPEGVRGIGIYSLGPDKRDQTADDIKSWWAEESAKEYRDKHPGK